MSLHQSASAPPACYVAYLPDPIGNPVEGVVVKDHKVPVSASLHVGFYHIGADLDGAFK